MIKNDNILYDKDTNEPVIKIENIQHIENNIIDIKGYPENLLNLGWKPMHNIDFILNELLDYTE